MNWFEQRLPLFPITTELHDGKMTLAGLSLHDLAGQFGTPLYLYDQATLDDALDQYRRALQSDYPGESGVTYAGKAFFGLAIAGWAARRGLTIDCTGAGEIGVAAAAGVPPAQVLVHGVSKSRQDLAAAFQQAGTLVVDNPVELQQVIAARDAQARPAPQIWLRLRPGVAVETHHAYTQTGQADSKFGMDPLEFLEALRCALDAGLEVTGLHFHQGSHFHDPEPLGPALEMALDLAAEMRTALGWTPRVLCPGGGWGIPYHEDDLPHPPIDAYVGYIAEKVIRGCRARGLPLPRLQLEPGRSLVGRAGIAVYRVDAVKHSARRRWLLLDGGMADNPRPALYRARYTALPVEGLQRADAGPAFLAGPFCESGDVLIENLPMPDVQPGELVALPAGGAYHLSMGSNYNGARRPAVVWLDDRGSHLIRRRETVEDLIRRDLPLPE